MEPTALLLVVIALLIAFSYTAHASPAMTRARRAMAVGVGVLLALWFIGHFRAILPPFVVPIILAYLLDPILDALERRGIGRVRAILLVYLLLLVVMIAAALLVIPALISQIGAMIRPLTSGEAIDLTALGAYLEFPDKILKGIEKSALDAGLKPEWVTALGDNMASYRIEERLQVAGTWLVTQLSSTVVWFQRQVSGLMWLILLPITLFYCLRDFDPLRRRLYYLVPRERRDEVSGIAGQINRALGNYLRGYVVLSITVGLLQTLVLVGLQQVFDFRYALLMGLLAGMTYIIPFIGSLVATFVTAGVVFFTGGHSLLEAGVVWAVAQGINSVFDNVVTPRAIGKEVGLHPLVVMFALLAGGSQFGLLGVILATPVTACLKIVLSHFVPRLSEPIPDDETPEAAERGAPAADRAEPADDRGPDS